MTINVLDAIADGRYNNKVQYSRDQKQLYRGEQARLDAMFKSDLETQYGIIGHPKADKLFWLAWDSGHATGYEEVAHAYSEMVELLL